MIKTYIKGGFIFFGILLCFFSLMLLLVVGFNFKLNVCIPNTHTCLYLSETMYNLSIGILEIPVSIIKSPLRFISNNDFVTSLLGILFIIIFYFNIGGLLGVFFVKIRSSFNDYQWVKFKKILISSILGIGLLAILSILSLFYILIPKGSAYFYSGGNPFIQYEFTTTCNGKSFLLNRRDTQNDGSPLYLCIGSLKSELNPYYQEDLNNPHYPY